MSTIPSNQNFPSKNQIPANSIMDKFDKQVYLGNYFRFVATIALASASEAPIYLLKCPPTSLKSIFLNLNRIIGATASQTVTVRVYLNPTVSLAGTSKTPLNARPANANASIADFESAPSVSANGTLMSAILAAPLAQGQTDELIILDPGQSLLITAQGTAAMSVISEQGWYEL